MSVASATRHLFRGARHVLATSAMHQMPLVTVIPAKVKQQKMIREMSTIKELVFSMTGYNQFGLYHDDALYETPVIKEAVRRLPPQMQDERQFRIQRALHASMCHTVLPKDEWPSYEEDRSKGRYLQPYIKEVEREWKEQAEWAKK